MSGPKGSLKGLLLPESPWAYRIMFVLSTGLFSVAAWGPVAFSSWPQMPALERQFVVPQVKLILWLAPLLAEKWPGPVAGPLTSDYRLLLGLACAGIGWFIGRLIFLLVDGWPSRLAWLLAVWLVWMSMVLLFGWILSF